MKSFIFIVGLITLPAALIMAFETPNNKEIISAIGSTNDLPDSLQRALSIDDFEPIPSPRPGDWLAEHHEEGQTYDDFLQSDHKRPDEIRNVIYLQPIGQFRQDQSPSSEVEIEELVVYGDLEDRLINANLLHKKSGSIKKAIICSTFDIST